MISNKNISKGGIIGALLGALASVFMHKQTDSTSKAVIKTGIFSAIGYFLGTFAEKKVNERKQSHL